MLILLLVGMNAPSFAQDGGVKAKIGIMHKSGEKISRMKSNDRAKAGDQMRIFIKAQTDCNVYVIYSDENESMLLNDATYDEKLIDGNTLILPSTEDFYQFDDQSSLAHISIICTAAPLKKIENLFAESLSVSKDKWAIIEEAIIEETKVSITDTTEKPFSIAGNVRSLNSEFDSKLRTFEDDTIIFRKFKLDIK